MTLTYKSRNYSIIESQNKIEVKRLILGHLDIKGSALQLKVSESKLRLIKAILEFASSSLYFFFDLLNSKNIETHMKIIDLGLRYILIHILKLKQLVYPKIQFVFTNILIKTQCPSKENLLS